MCSKTVSFVPKKCPYVQRNVQLVFEKCSCIRKTCTTVLKTYFTSKKKECSLFPKNVCSWGLKRKSLVRKKACSWVWKKMLQFFSGIEKTIHIFEKIPGSKKLSLPKEE